MKLTSPVLAGGISMAMVVLALLFSNFVLGMDVVVPIMDYFIEARRASGESVGVVEAVTAFLLVMSFMLVITLLVGAAALSGWVVNRLAETGRFSVRGLISLFTVEEPE